MRVRKGKNGSVAVDIVMTLIVIGVAIGFVLWMGSCDKKSEQKRHMRFEALRAKGPYYRLIEKQAPVEKGETHYYLFFKKSVVIDKGKYEGFGFELDISYSRTYKAEVELDTYILFEKGQVYSAKELPLIEVIDFLKPLPIKAEKPEK